MSKPDKILSILLSPGGLVFWVGDGREVCYDYDRRLPPAENLRRGLAHARKKAGRRVARVRIYPDTAKTAVVPRELFDPEIAREYLEINGIAVESTDRLIISNMDRGGEKIKIVTAVDSAWVDAAEGVFEGDAEYLSPFLLSNGIFLTPQSAYITVCAPGGRMLFCEVLPHSSPADVLYYMTELAARFDLLKSVILIKGHGAREARGALRKTFKKVKCE